MQNRAKPPLPKHFPLTWYRKGFKKWINGKPRHICGHLPPRQALARYHELLRGGKFDDHPTVGLSPPRLDEGMTVKQLANHYLAHLQERVEDRTGRRRPASLRHYDCAVRALQLFADSVCGDDDPAAASLLPTHFSIYVAAIPGHSPTSHNRYVAPITAMYRHALRNLWIPRPVNFGTDMDRASADQLRQQRDERAYSFTIPEIRRLYQAATPRMRAFMVLGLNCAFHNVDIGRLRWQHVDFAQNLIRLGRLKRGLSARVAPLWPETRDALIAEFANSRRAVPRDPRDVDRVFITQFGLPYCETYAKRDEAGVLIGAKPHDSVRLSWAATKRAAGFCPDGRGFKGMRTTFRTLCERLPARARDYSAINAIMGHKTASIAESYVEELPLDRLQVVVDEVRRLLWEGWAIPLSESPPRMVQVGAWICREGRPKGRKVAAAALEVSVVGTKNAKPQSQRPGSSSRRALIQAIADPQP